jgi:ribosome-binding factor A
MTVPGRRQARLAGQIRTEVAEMLAGELNDPRIGFATVTRVELTADLHHARILVSVLGSADEGARSLEGLSSAAGYIRRELARRLGLRHVPELVFVLDHGAEDGLKIESLLRELKKDE